MTLEPMAKPTYRQLWEAMGALLDAHSRTDELLDRLAANPSELTEDEQDEQAGACRVRADAQQVWAAAVKDTDAEDPPVMASRTQLVHALSKAERVLVNLSEDLGLTPADAAASAAEIRALLGGELNPEA